MLKDGYAIKDEVPISIEDKDKKIILRRQQFDDPNKPENTMMEMEAMGVHPRQYYKSFQNMTVE